VPFSDSFDRFRDTLSRRLRLADRVGASPGTVLNAAKDLAEWLHDEVDPQNPEQRLLKELWDVADDNEKHSLINLLIKFVRTDARQGVR
jgi:disulfide oxidoreductase YuzD